MDIREEISNNRKKRVEREGYGLSITIPEKREAPLIDFSKGPFVICEVKRGSPSKGHFAKELDEVEQATKYWDSGVKHVSILTEEDYFYGSLQDLINIKKRCPTLSVLRKDFLLDLTDVETSYLCGADAYLLITSLLDRDLLYSMYWRGKELGMTPLVEVHDKDDVEKVRELRPSIIGINSRDLKNFTIDPLRPLKIRSYIDWECDIIYESGISSKEDGEFARDSNFSGVLVGEWAVKKESLPGELVSVFEKSRVYNPWERLFNSYKENRPFIKICGLTNKEDVDLAVDLGANLLGFILAESPRKVEIDFIKTQIIDKRILKVGVVVLSKGEKLSDDIKQLVYDGYLDFIQYHGDETLKECINNGVPFYKAISIKNRESLNKMNSYGPVVLLDSFSASKRGGTGKSIDRKLTAIARNNPNLWLAGGLNTENISSVLEEFKPEFIDVSSGLELYPGKKSKEKMIKFFKELI
ncbi:bifunctional indole-3-glycerol phosphate synthase/phosphoribosylanthranilate isomerase [Thiospirochaeta perfilievii]|uniref:N-(5'-phosphoribosyl)anthranilate isomerase n=1 Tax=Thiospirochaeta perfilievii TaxID=252967 RepID=A0A5C1QES3_9SPIO|nr:bifunctional indole-3-glycerol phosphate synthase/phosphoribosylanthranilate isomerase [Thiospirochaeta perfilievii]QEN06071.1 bifunctional indole-3-glycerol phosphate synthase/phosphoribosylanthranilate isomerase [Thiospirochaeta perfilievii]